MAKTWRPRSYFGYEGRNKEDRFNWADVGTKAAQAIEDNAKDREIRKEEYRQFNNTFETLQSKGNELATSNNASLNNQIVATTQRAVDKYYEFYKKFTNGEISESDWVQYRTNIMDGLNNYFGIMAGYSQQYENKMQRKMEGKSQTLEQNQMSQIEGFSNYSQWQTRFGGDGRMYIARLGKDGVQKEGTGNVFRVSALRHNVDTEVNKFDVDAAVTQIEGQIGEFVKDIRRRVTTNKKLRKDYEDVRDARINSYLNDSPFNVLSILTENLTGFEIVRDPSLADDTHILVETDPETGFETPVITEAHLNVAREYMATLVDGKVDIKEQGQRASNYVRNTRKEKSKAKYDLLYNTLMTYVQNPTTANLKTLKNVSLSDKGGTLKMLDNELQVTTDDGQDAGTIKIEPGNELNIARSLWGILAGPDGREAWKDLGGKGGIRSMDLSGFEDGKLEDVSVTWTAFEKDDKDDDKVNKLDEKEYDNNLKTINDLKLKIKELETDSGFYEDADFNDDEKKAEKEKLEKEIKDLRAENEKIRSRSGKKKKNQGGQGGEGGVDYTQK